MEDAPDCVSAALPVPPTNTMFEAGFDGVLVLESESLPVPATSVMELPPVDDSVSFPVALNMLMEQRPDCVSAALPVPPTSTMFEAGFDGVLVLESESLPV